MEKIDLDMEVMQWFESACEKHVTLIDIEWQGKVRDALLAMPFMENDATMRGLCKTSFLDFFLYDFRVVCALIYLLGKYGLRIEMKDDELAEYEDKPMPQDVSSDTIDWEQRRWELAVSLFVHWSDISDFNGVAPVDIADKFIKEYKKNIENEQ